MKTNLTEAYGNNEMIDNNIIPFPISKADNIENSKKILKKSYYIVKYFDKVMKVMGDTFCALVGVILLSPLFLIIAIAIKLDSKGPVIFKQARTGKNGKTFYIYKFRSIVVENDVHDFSQEDKHTRVGKILRKTSLDELPQLINIIKQEMSFIGPRPWIPEYYENMTELQRHRFDVKPGISGLAQCNGRNALTIFDKINYDLEYIRNFSIGEDFKIAVLTAKQIISRKRSRRWKSNNQGRTRRFKKTKFKNG